MSVAALQLSLELATRTPGLGWGESLPSDVGECMQREVQALAGLKRRLRDDDARSMVVREHVADALTALSQQRLASAVEALVRGTAGAREVPMFQVVRYAAARGVENMFRRGRSQRAGSREARSRGAALGWSELSWIVAIFCAIHTIWYVQSV